MRESGFKERIEAIKKEYIGIGDFEAETVVHLENEFNNVSSSYPEHTKRRREILDMRHRLLSCIRVKPQKTKKDMYIDVFRTSGGNADNLIAYCDGNMYGMKSNDATFEDMIDRLIYITGLDDKNIFIDTNGIGIGLADVLDSKGIRYNKIKFISLRTK